MKSPFFWQNTFLLLLLVANFALSVWLVARKPDDPRVDPVDSAETLSTRNAAQKLAAWGIACRILCVIYATASCLILFVLALQFRDNEFLPTSQEYWRQRNAYPKVQLGMTQKLVLEIMDKPQDVWRQNDNDQYRYLLSPSGLPENASISFGPDPKNPGGEVIVIDKWPEDIRVNALNRWWRGHLIFEYWRDWNSLCEKGMGLSCMAILLLAVVSMVPFWPCNDWRSLSLYFPVMALTVGLAHEIIRRGDLRFVVFIFAPASVVVLISWLVRVICLARR